MAEIGLVPRLAAALFSALFSHAGRLDRGGWWTRMALVAALWVAQDALASEESLTFFAEHLGRRPATLAAVWGAVALLWIAGVWILVVASARRLRDRGQPGLRLLAFALPAIVAAHWLERLWFSWIAFVLALLWGLVELGVLPGEAAPREPGAR